MSVQVSDELSLDTEVLDSLATDAIRADAMARAEFMERSVIGVTVDLLATGISGGSWMRAQEPLCEGCNGWLMDIDGDDSIAAGGRDAPTPCCSCTFTRLWTSEQWAAFRVRMDRLVAAWTAFYGPADPGLVAERQEWVRQQHERYPSNAAG